MTSCGGLFRKHNGKFVFDFARVVEGSPFLHSELWGVNHAVDIAYHFSWNHVWFETYSSLVLLALENAFLVIGRYVTYG